MQRIKFDERRGHLGISGKINPVLESDYLWVGFLSIIIALNSPAAGWRELIKKSSLHGLIYGTLSHQYPYPFQPAQADSASGRTGLQPVVDLEPGRATPVFAHWSGALGGDKAQSGPFP